MRFNSVRTGDYSQSAKAVTRASDQIFSTAMSNVPDFTAISKEAIKGRSAERRAVTKAEGDVATAGIRAFTNTKLTKMRADTKKDVANILRPAKRMAGIVGGLGAIAGGYVMMEGNKKDKAERDELRTYRDEIEAKQDLRDAEQQKRIDAVLAKLNNMSSGGSGSADPKPSTPVTQQAGVSSAAPSNISSPKSKSTGLTPNAKSAPGFKGFVDMASTAGAKYPQLVAAQWALESGWGKTPSGKNNYFGIKAGGGEQGTSKQTWEVYGGKEVTTSARFKDFDSPQGAVNELVDKWHKDYKTYSGVNNASDAFSAADMLRQQGYATDPSYSEKLKKIMRDQGY